MTNEQIQRLLSRLAEIGPGGRLSIETADGYGWVLSADVFNPSGGTISARRALLDTELQADRYPEERVVAEFTRAIDAILDKAGG